MIEIKNLTKSYNGKKKAVDNASFTVGDGEIFAFIGHNGAGKTTTIKSIVGILDFDSGDILINGKSIKEDPIGCKMDMAYVPDNPDLYEHLTGIGYLDFIANIYGVGSEKNELIDKYATQFGIKERLADPIKAYSHGMKQKITLIGALIHNPKLIILDEPFVGLDPKAAHDLKEILKSLCEKGTMIFFSSHVLEVVEKFCNKIAIIKDGKIIASGLTEEVKGNESLEDKFLELFE